MKPRNTPYWAALLFAMLGVAALAIDIPVGRWARDNWTPGDITKLLNISEVFAHGFGVALILITIAVLDRRSWFKLPRVAACTFGSGLIAQCSKALIPRIRPREFDFSGTVFSSFFPVGEVTQSAWIHSLQRGVQSFPSGHTAVAVGLAIGLTWLYPRGKWLFAAFALLAAIQRIDSSAHFVSDTLAAATIATLFAGLCLDDRALGKLFDRLERREKEGG